MVSNVKILRSEDIFAGSPVKIPFFSVPPIERTIFCPILLQSFAAYARHSLTFLDIQYTGITVHSFIDKLYVYIRFRVLFFFFLVRAYICIYLWLFSCSERFGMRPVIVSDGLFVLWLVASKRL